MRKHVKGLVAAMEEESRIAEQTMPEVEPAAETVENDLIEISEDAAEGEQAEAEMEEAGEVSEALEAMHEVMAKAAANGGLDRHGAQLASIAIDHLYKRIGIKSNAMPALESFGGTSSRVGATQIAMEEIKSNLKKIWDAIVVAVKKSIEWIKATFMKVFDAATKLDDRSKKLLAMAEKTTGALKKDSKIENETIAKAISVGGKVAANATASGVLKDTGKAVFSTIADLSGKKGDEIASVLEAADTSIPADWLDKMGTDLGPAPGTKPISNGKDYGAPEGTRAAISNELPGNRAIFTVMAGEGKSGAEAVIAHQTKLIQFNKEQGEVSATLPVLSVNDAKEVITDIAELVKEILAYKAKVDAISKIKERIVKAADKLSKREPKEGEKEKLQTVEKVVRTSASQLDAPMAEFSIYGLKTGNAFLQYAELSLKQYEGA